MPRNLFLLYKNTIHKSLGSTVCSRLLVFVFMYLSMGNVNAQNNGFDYFNYEDEPYLRTQYKSMFYGAETDLYSSGYRNNNPVNHIGIDMLTTYDEATDNPDREVNEKLHESIRTKPETKNNEPEISANSIDLPDVPDVPISDPFLMLLLLLMGTRVYN